MLHFIAGVLVGSLAATYAIALISNNEDALREQKIRELRTANRTLQEEYASAKRLEMYWRALLHEHEPWGQGRKPGHDS